MSNLHETEALFRALFEQSNDAVFILDMEHNLLMTNRRATQLSGYSREELSRIVYCDLIIPMQQSQVDAIFEQLLAGISVPPHEQIFCHKDGHYIPVEVNIELVQDTSGVPIHIQSIVRDITERKQMEDVLRQNEARYRSMFENNRAIKLLIDSETGLIIDANTAAVDYYGYSHDTLLTMRIQDINVLTEEEVKAEMASARSEQRTVFNFCHKLHNGDIRDVEVFSGPVDIQGKPYLYSIILDVTKRKQAERELARNEQRLKMIIQGTGAGTWEWNIQTGETTFNKRWAEIIGYTLEELEPISLKTWADHTHPDDLQRSNELIIKHFAGELESYECEVRMIHKDGHPVWILDLGRVMEWTEDGQPLRMFGTHIDITDRKQAMEQEINLFLEQERRQILTNFLGDATHEFRTPLATINASTYLMTRIDDFETRVEKAEQIKSHIGHITRLVDTLSMMAKLESNQVLSKTSVDIVDILDILKQEITSKCTRNHVVHHNISSDLPAIYGNREYLLEALRQIVNNTCRFTPDRGIVSLEAGVEGNCIWIDISDTGPGISETALPHIFETFWRQDTAHSTPGLGLGLPIAKKIIEHHDGKITIKHTGKDGSTFRVTLPIAKVSG